jgi:probable F420-dependent oxidoreductase
LSRPLILGDLSGRRDEWLGLHATLRGMELGRVGIWQRRHEVSADAAREIESLGYSALWLGASPAPADTRPFLERTSTLVVATGILNVWQHEPAEVAARHAELTRAFPGRFLLGIGVGHPEAINVYERPLAKMGAFFDGLDAAEQPVPRDQRVAAALGPKMLDLAAERSLGAIPYFVTADHTRFARERMGGGALLAPEVAVVVEPDREVARAKARRYTATYLAATNYLRSLRRLGFSERDLADGGSDRLIDAVIPHGSPEAIAEAVGAHFDAGANHVCLQPIAHAYPPVDDYRSLARALLA